MKERGNEKCVAQCGNNTMAFEERNGNYYYYKKERDGKRVISRYCGKGEIALLIAQMDEMERGEKAEKVEIHRKNREKDAKIDNELTELEQNTKSLVKNFLINKGFYQTKSREWRLKSNER